MMEEMAGKQQLERRAFQRHWGFVGFVLAALAPAVLIANQTPSLSQNTVCSQEAYS